MPKLQLKVSGKFETNGFQYYPENYQENFFRPKEVESKKEMENLISSNPNAAWCLGVRTHDGSKSHFSLSLSLTSDGANKHSIKVVNGSGGVELAVDGIYWVEIEDEDTLKYLKKSLKNNTVKFSIVEAFMVREEIPMTPFGPEGGTFKGIDWDDYPSMPQAELIGNDITSATTKPAKPKKPTELTLPVKVTLEKELSADEVVSTQAALDDGIQLNIGLSVPGGSNEIIIRPSELDGKFSAKITKNKLKISIDAFVRFKIDAWVRKYADKSPFDVTLSSYWDGSGNKVFLGEIDPNTGFPGEVVVGKADISV